MVINGKVHCLFEQSGTFKNEFKKLGYEAYDYDIQNNFGETDYTDDLFKAIEDAYDGKPSLFDRITPDDLIMAFFPCIYFCENNELYFTGKHFNLKNKSRNEVDRIVMERANNRHFFYVMLLKFFNVCSTKDLRLIVENPFSIQHYLYNNFPYAPTVIDKDRTRRGDYYKKPTQYFFVNCKNTVGESFQEPKDRKSIASSASGIKAGICSEERSLISSDYARNFICDFVLGREQSLKKQYSLF